MDEDDFVEKLGMVTSPTLALLMGKAGQNVIAHLKRLEKYQIIKIEEFRHSNGTRRIYIKNEIHKDIFKD